MRYLVLFAIVFGVNLLPAFGPPTWTILVFARVSWHLAPVAIVIIGAVAAMSGRYLLAVGTRHFRGHLSDKRRANIQAADDLMFAKKGRAWALLGVFVVSPLPSAQLFVAAGMLNVALVPLTLAFFVGRLVSYSFYVVAATLAERQLGGVLRNALGTWWSVLLQLVLLAAVAALPLIDWTKVRDRWQARTAARGRGMATADPGGPTGRSTGSQGCDGDGGAPSTSKYSSSG